MADIEFYCPYCDQVLEGPEDMAGETIDCPACERTFTIPRLDEDDASEAVCPHCKASMESDTILCLACGFHQGLGKCIHTETQ